VTSEPDLPARLDFAVEQRETVTPPALARHYGVSPDKIVGWINSGELAAINVAAKPNGRPRWRITAEAVIEFEQRRSSKPPITPTRRRRRKDPNVIEFF